MGKRYPVRGQAAKWCVCGEWFASERDEREHVRKCPGPRERQWRGRVAHDPATCGPCDVELREIERATPPQEAPRD